MSTFRPWSSLSLFVFVSTPTRGSNDRMRLSSLLHFRRLNPIPSSSRTTGRSPPRRTQTPSLSSSCTTTLTPPWTCCSSLLLSPCHPIFFFCSIPGCCFWGINIATMSCCSPSGRVVVIIVYRTAARGVGGDVSGSPGCCWDSLLQW